VFAPTRLLTAIKPSASPGVLTAAAAVTVVFAATPFLVPEVASRFGVSLGTAGLISTAQVAGFALSSFVAGRMARGSRRLLVGAGVVATLASVASALVGSFALLLATRVVAGLAMGVITWLAWADATRHEGGIGDVAAVGPVAAMVATPGLAWLAQSGGHRLVYLVLAAFTLLAALVPAEVAPTEPVGRSVSRSRSNRVLLAALMVFTMAGSGLFVFAAVPGEMAGLSAVAVSLGFSLNALASIAGTRTVARGRTAWLWMTATGASAFVVGLVPLGWAYLTAMAVWGYAFWVAIPQVFRLLAAKSNRPEERVGDAQAVMGFGRMIGPAVGGIVLGADRFTALTLAATAGVVMAALMVGMVEIRRGPTL
jgi:MFS transporter, DHA1 family, chloramphenicol resistance protein